MPFILFQLESVSKGLRQGVSGMSGWAIWLTGMPGSGKSTLARLVARRLLQKHIHTQVLSIEMVREILTAHPKYSEEERRMVYGALVFVAEESTLDNGLIPGQNPRLGAGNDADDPEDRDPTHVVQRDEDRRRGVGLVLILRRHETHLRLRPKPFDGGVVEGRKKEFLRICRLRHLVIRRPHEDPCQWAWSTGNLAEGEAEADGEGC